MAREIEPHDGGGGDGGAIAQVDSACREGTERSSQHASVGEMGGRCIELVLRLDVVDRAEEKKNSRKQPESRVALAAALGRQCRCRLICERRHWRAKAPASGTRRARLERPPA